jgi:L-threonylcarbamoyladenylate synthase
MPTETVYGLACDARRDDAVAKVFERKGRPPTNPLIVHVHSVAAAGRFALLDDRARVLLDTLSPGPLTVIVPVKPVISNLVTAGLGGVGIRIPRHPVALRLLRDFDGPLAAPSANKSNHISPTTADHVRREFDDAVFVLNGGPCEVGIESTVLSLVEPTPVILRPGSVDAHTIGSLIGAVIERGGHEAVDIASASPGRHERHYAPRAPAFRVEADDPRFRASGKSVDGLPASAVGAIWIELPDEPKAAMRTFYAQLREADEKSPSRILIRMPPDTPDWRALRDRIRRATRPLNDTL